MTATRLLPTADDLRRAWRESPRWRGIERGYRPEDVVRLRGTIPVEYSIARLTAEKLWRYLNEKPFVNALGALTGNQAMQQVKAGLDAIYLSGWQVAADANLSGAMYPDQSLYPADSVPAVVRRINSTLRRADEIHHAEGNGDIDWLKPIVADAEAGFGGVLNAFELMKQMIDAGAAGVHFEDQLSSAKKCGHMGGKVLVPTQEAINKLVAARLAADVCNVPTIIVARTDAEAANLLTSDVDERDRPFIDAAKGRTAEGFFCVKAGLEQAIARACAYAPYADLVWCETAKPDLEEARHFAEAVHERFPGKPRYQVIRCHCKSPSPPCEMTPGQPPDSGSIAVRFAQTFPAGDFFEPILPSIRKARPVCRGHAGVAAWRAPGRMDRNEKT